MELDWNIVWTHRYDLLHGAGLTVLLTVLTMLVAVPLGIVLALMRLSSSKALSGASQVFVEFFRNLPLILVVYWAFYVMPVLMHIEFSAFTTGLVALCLNVGLQRRDLPRRHQLDPQGADGGRHRDGHEPLAGHEESGDPAGLAARAAGAGDETRLIGANRTS